MFLRILLVSALGVSCSSLPDYGSGDPSFESGQSISAGHLTSNSFDERAERFNSNDKPLFGEDSRESYGKISHDFFGRTDGGLDEGLRQGNIGNKQGGSAFGKGDSLQRYGTTSTEYNLVGKGQRSSFGEAVKNGDSSKQRSEFNQRNLQSREGNKSKNSQFGADFGRGQEKHSQRFRDSTSSQDSFFGGFGTSDIDRTGLGNQRNRQRTSHANFRKPGQASFTQQEVFQAGRKQVESSDGYGGQNNERLSSHSRQRTSSGRFRAPVGFNKPNKERERPLGKFEAPNRIGRNRGRPEEFNKQQGSLKFGENRNHQYGEFGDLSSREKTTSFGGFRGSNEFGISNSQRRSQTPAQEELENFEKPRSQNKGPLRESKTNIREFERFDNVQNSRQRLYGGSNRRIAGSLRGQEGFNREPEESRGFGSSNQQEGLFNSQELNKLGEEYGSQITRLEGFNRRQNKIESLNAIAKPKGEERLFAGGRGELGEEHKQQTSGFEEPHRTQISSFGRFGDSGKLSSPDGGSSEDFSRGHKSSLGGLGVSRGFVSSNEQKGQLTRGQGYFEKGYGDQNKEQEAPLGGFGDTNKGQENPSLRFESSTGYDSSKSGNFGEGQSQQPRGLGGSRGFESKKGNFQNREDVFVREQEELQKGYSNQREQFGSSVGRQTDSSKGFVRLSQPESHHGFGENFGGFGVGSASLQDQREGSFGRGESETQHGTSKDSRFGSSGIGQISKQRGTSPQDNRGSGEGYGTPSYEFNGDFNQQNTDGIGFGLDNQQVEGPPRHIVPILRNEREGPVDGFYSFEFETGDGIIRQEQGTPDGPNGSVIQQGGWSFTFPDGTPAEFSFIADENGYRVESSLIPTPPPHALAQIEKARREKIAGGEGEENVDDFGGQSETLESEQGFHDGPQPELNPEFSRSGHLSYGY